MKAKSRSIKTYERKLAETTSLEKLISHAEDAETDEEILVALKTMLGYAVTLEFATIPIYLSALWTIKDNTCDVANSIRNIIQEEMLHMSMVCNMLVGIGGEPKIYNTKERLTFPTGLPGEVHTELFLYLEGLNDCSLRNFMEIELPDHVADIYDYKTGKLVKLTELCGVDGHDKKKKVKNQSHEHSSTIGALYDKINKLFDRLQPEMNIERQLSGPLAWFVMKNAASVNKAIEFIKEQGEGSEDVTPASTGMDDLAHFYRFWEVYEEKKIVEVKEGKEVKYYFKDPFPRPECYDTARIPKGGYQKENVTPEVWFLINEFDKTYSELVMLLEDAWAQDGGGQASLVKAVEVMFKLEKYALPLIKTPIPGSREGLNYGPCFRIIDVH